MVRSNQELDEIAAEFVCVRVTDMSGVDLNVYRFDYDLTWAALLMSPDGKIHHTFAGRDWTDADSHHDLDALAAIMRTSLTEHRIHQRRGRHPRRVEALTIEEVPAMARHIAEKGVPNCIHCHTVHDKLHEDMRRQQTWTPNDRWIWPDPIQVGVRLDRVDQILVTEVRTGSPAATAGLEPGDRIDRIGDQRVRTFGDVQRVLNGVDAANPGPLSLESLRGGKVHKTSIELPAGWRAADPLVYAWRPSKWPLSPQPGFGGPELSAREKAQRGLSAEEFAFRVQYLVNAGEHARAGRNAVKAGIRKGDWILAADGKRDFESTDHFQSWFRLTRTVGEPVEIEVLRNTKRLTVSLSPVK